MQVYHLSDTLSLGGTVTPDYKRNAALAEPFVKALERGETCFWATVYSTQFLSESLEKFGMADMQTDWDKWACEGVFEYIRRREFPEAPPRLQAGYYFQRLEDCIELFAVDWGKASAEERARIHLYRMDLADEHPSLFDMRLFDAAYDLLWEREDLPALMGIARQYFRGEGSEHPVWELLSTGTGRAVEDLSHLLHPREER